MNSSYGRSADGYSSGPIAADARTSVRHIIIDAALFYSMFSLIIAILIGYFRQPLGSPGVSVIAGYWLSVVAGMLAYAGPFLRHRGTWRSEVVAVMSFLAAFGIIIVGGQGGIAVTLAALLVGATILASKMRYPLPTIGAISIFAATALALGTACFILVNSMDYATVFSPERTLAGIHNGDELFHTSIASMFAHYGVPGTGLDGLKPFQYHLLSHISLGLMAQNFGVNSVFGYFLGMQIIAVPLVYFALTVASTAFIEPDIKIANRALILVIPIAVLFAFEQWLWLSYLVSESYIFGLILLLSSLPLLRSMVRCSDSKLPHPIILIGFVVGLLAIAAKVSVGFVWFAGFFYLLVRRSGISRVQYVSCAVMSLLTFWIAWTYLLPIEHSENGKVELFHFLKHYPTEAMGSLLPIALATALQLKRWHSDTSSERLWRESVVVMMLGSLAPAFVLRLDGGSAHYFINIGVWIAVAALAGEVMSAFRTIASRFVFPACTLILVVSFLQHPDRRSALRNFISERDQLIEHVLDHEIHPYLEEEPLFSRDALMRLAKGMHNTVGERLSKTLQSVGLKAGDKTFVFIEPDVEEFWSMHPQCQMSQFVVPSFFGVPLLKGLPPAERGCKLGNYYSLPSYGPNAAATPATDSELCRAASAYGVSNVVRVNSLSQARKLVCFSIGL